MCKEKYMTAHTLEASDYEALSSFFKILIEADKEIKKEGTYEVNVPVRYRGGPAPPQR